MYKMLDLGVFVSVCAHAMQVGKKRPGLRWSKNIHMEGDVGTSHKKNKYWNIAAKHKRP